ncbi:acyltransferase [Homoserinibacter sp. GY 40078]|uniref:acyltransferase family protein n=1 Tax=Homoserinibacter sp. GY 40078 TaxID=2603275 RepID=UPI0011C97BF6|nr:acyltransferase [Homoserinibacter sp. GY 40078]TXK19498.1 acyltransferase [Homoserinibacter sp. GY 40078]
MMTTPTRRAAPQTAGPALNSANRFAHIDAMRAVAVMLVVVMHAGIRVSPGDSGVTIFFTISGFIITFLLISERDRAGAFNVRRFYARRLWKIAPPFVLIIAVPTLVYALFATISWPAFLTQIFFSYNWAEIYLPGAFDGVLPGSTVVWSLAVEEQFYIVFALLWIMLVRSRHWRIGLVSIALVGVVGSLAARVALSFDADSLHAMRGTDARLEAIAWGVLCAALLHRHGEHPSRALAWVGSAPALIIAATLYGVSFAIPGGWAETAFRPTLWAIAAAIAVLWGMLPSDGRAKELMLRVAGWRVLQLIGLASYSIYLAHDVIIHLVRALLPEVPGVAMLLGGLGGVAVGIAVYFAVERPVARLSRRRHRVKETQA